MSTSRKKPRETTAVARRFRDAKAWKAWLEKNHAKSHGIWLKLARKGSGLPSVTKTEALDCALCYGWIDAQSRSGDEDYWLQRFTPRARKSIWSKINREKVAALIAAGRMQPAGLREIERAKEDGRWAAAYDSVRSATVPPDLAAALKKNPRAARFFQTLSSKNRYAILFRHQTAKKAETKARRIKQFVEMLEREETIHPA